MTTENAATEHLTTCRLCPAFCGMVVTIEDQNIIKSRGDSEHPISRGYLCPKGFGLPAFHHHEKRLGHPALHGKPACWDSTLDDLSDRLKSILAEHGPEAVGYYSASGGAYDTAGRASVIEFFSQLGTQQRYTAVTVDSAPAFRAAQLVTGYTLEVRPEWFPDDQAPRLGIILGSNPVISHGHLGLMLPDPTRRLREYREGGGELWVLDPRYTETARCADHYLALRPGSDGAVLAFLVRELLEDGADEEELAHYVRPAELERLRTGVQPFTLAVAAEQSGLSEEQLEQLLAAIRRVGKIALTGGTGLNFGPNAMVTEWLMWVVLIITGSIDREGGMAANAGWWTTNESRENWQPMPEGRQPQAPRSRPDLPMWLGEVPCAAMVDEIESGNLKALFINGGSPLTAFPDPDRLLSALHSLDVLVVVDVLETELTEIATHVFAVASMLERTDMPGGWNHHIGYSPQLLDVAEDRRQTWWIFAKLGQRLGFDILDGMDADTATDVELIKRIADTGRQPSAEVMNAGPRGLLIPRPFGWVHERALPEGYWRLAPKEVIERLSKLLDAKDQNTLLLVSGRELHNHNRVAYGRFKTNAKPSAIGLHPEDAAVAGVNDGDIVEVRGDAGYVTATARLDKRLRKGCVHLVHGLTSMNVSRLIGREMDPLHGQPVMSAIPVTISTIGA